MGILSLADSAHKRFVGAKVLGKDALPDVEPFLLLRGGQLAGLSEGLVEHLAEPRTQNLDDEHRLPVGDGEAAAVSVKNYDAREHLWQGLSALCSKGQRMRGEGCSYITSDVAAEKGDGKGLHGRGFVCMVYSVRMVNVNMLTKPRC